VLNSLHMSCLTNVRIQVSRTDANALLALDPEDLTVVKKFNYTSILPEAKVSHTAAAMQCMLLLFTAIACLCTMCRMTDCSRL